MGDAGITLSPDANATFWDLGKVAFAESPDAIGVTYTPWLADIAQDVYMISLAGYHKIDEDQGFAAKADAAIEVLVGKNSSLLVNRAQTLQRQMDAYDERIELDRKDELGALASAFNAMAGQVQELITGLERRVAERTKALEVASKHKSEFGTTRVARWFG